MNEEGKVNVQDVIGELLKLKEAIEKTLLDLRELMNNLENPFNYIVLSSEQGQERTERKQEQQTSESVGRLEQAISEREKKREDTGIETETSKKVTARVGKEKRRKKFSGRTIRSSINVGDVLRSILSASRSCWTIDSEVLQLVDALVNLYTMLKIYKIPVEKVEALLHTLHEYGIVDNRSYRTYMAALELISESLHDSSVMGLARLVCSILKICGLEPLSRLIALILNLSKPYEVEIV